MIAAVWQGAQYREGQCRPGGADAAIYDLSNGARFCSIIKTKQSFSVQIFCVRSQALNDFHDD